MNWLQGLLGQLWFHFALVALLGFLTGLEYREYLLSRQRTTSFGTARTYAFIALLGFVLHALDPSFRLYLGGLAALVVWSSLFYLDKLHSGLKGILGQLIALLVYTYGPLAQLQPLWLVMLLFVSVVFILNARPLTHRITEHMEAQELLTLAKFLLLAAVILPLMPDRTVLPAIPTTPFRIWVAVVAISGISYVGYILQRYVFPDKGYLVTGLLGGLYSSTATTLVLARKARQAPGAASVINLGIIAASGMMYLRLLLLVVLLNPAFLPTTWLPFVLLGTGTIGVTLLALRQGAPTLQAPQPGETRNPLELGTAFLFGVLFIVMLLASQAVLRHFGTTGLQVLSFAMGFTDIDPFVLSLLKGNYPGVPREALATAIIVAAGSNNFLKALYALLAGGWRDNRLAIAALVALGVGTLAYGVLPWL